MNIDDNAGYYNVFTQPEHSSMFWSGYYDALYRQPNKNPYPPVSEAAEDYNKGYEYGGNDPSV